MGVEDRWPTSGQGMTVAGKEMWATRLDGLL